MKVTIPNQNELPSSEADANPETLCANFRFGCNGTTEGPDGKYLTLCDDCVNAEGYLLAGRGGVTFNKRRRHDGQRSEVKR